MSHSDITIQPREEYIEQAYLFKALRGRLTANEPIQNMLAQLREEVLSTTKLPMAIDFLLAEVRHVGTMSTAMKKLAHYFTQFQIFIIEQAEDDHGRFDMRVAFLILEAEANFRASHVDDEGGTNPVAMFLFQMETLCRNCLDYDYGLQAIAMDPIFNGQWQQWILDVRHKLGIVELADLIYVHSQHYLTRNPNSGHSYSENLASSPASETDGLTSEELQIGELQTESANPDDGKDGQDDNEDQESQVILFGEREGRIALANRRKEAHYLFASLQRQLNYPAVPRPVKHDPAVDLLPKLVKTIERMKTRIKLLEDEQRQSGIDLNQFMRKQK